MPQPAVLEDLQEPLLDSYRRSWARIMAEQHKLEMEPLSYRRKLRLTEMRHVIEDELASLDKDAARWVAEQFPQVYSAGMLSAPGGDIAWTQVHREAVEELGAELFGELLDATDGVRDSTKQLVRTVARDAALQKAIGGETAEQAAREMRRVLESKGIFAVTYSNGTRHGLAEYTQVAMRTTTAKAYNRGTLNAHAEVKFFEVFDGPNCGLSSHDDPRLALGMVISREDCEAYPISHPNCRRAFGPRPDITRSDYADKANPTSTAQQRQAQLEADAARGDREAQRELAGQKRREDIFTKREKRLAEQQERYRLADRDKRLAERQAKVRVDEETRLARAAQEAAAKAAAADLFPELPKLAAPESYADALKVVNPGRGIEQRRNNCHFVAPSMEMRARGYDVVASPTFKDHGRYDHNIERDWIDPATGETRRFQSVQVFKFGKKIPGKTTLPRLDRTIAEIEADLVLRTADWPPGARGYITGVWKNGGGHIWNMYKDEQGVLRYVDGQVQKTDVRSNLGKVTELKIMRVDDLEPVKDRLLLASTSRAEADFPEMPDWWYTDRGLPVSGSVKVTAEQQKEMGVRLLAQLHDDYGTAGRFAYSIQDMMYTLESQLKKLGVKDPHTQSKNLPPPGSSSGPLFRATGGAPDTKDLHTVEGRYSAERVKIHDAYVNKQLSSGVRVRDPEFRVMGGGAASGKSSIIRSGDVKLPEGHVLVNADEAKDAIPEYVQMLKDKDERAAAHVHEESSDMGKRLTQESLERGFNTVLDGIGNGSIDSLAAKIAKGRAAGAKRIMGDYVTVDTDEAVRRAVERGKKIGRFVPESVIRHGHEAVSKTFYQATKRNDMFDELRLWDTNNGVKLIYERVNGKEVIHDPAAWGRFLDKNPELRARR